MSMSLRASDPVDTRIVALRRRGMTFREIAEAVGCSRGFVAGRVAKAGLMGTGRNTRPVLSLAHRIAEDMAESDGDLVACAGRLRIDVQLARKHWRDIVSGLGVQAR